MNFKNHTETGERIVKEVAIALGFPDDKDLAARLLSAVLHVLRSQLTIEQSFRLMAHFPIILKGIYVDGWKYQEKPFKVKTIGDFVREVIHEDWPLGKQDISTVAEGENAIFAVFQVIKRRVSENEIEDILLSLPITLRLLWEQSAPYLNEYCDEPYAAQW